MTLVNEYGALDTIHNGAATIHNASVDLCDIASALRRVGMREMAEELVEIATEIREAKQHMVSAYHLEQNQRYKESQAELGTILSTLLGNMATEKKDNTTG